MSAMVSGVVLIAAFAALAALSAGLGLAAFRRAGARDAGPPAMTARNTVPGEQARL